MNAVECEPVPTRVLNPNASEASYESKQRRYRKTKLKKKKFIYIFFRGDFGSGDFVGGISSWNRINAMQLFDKEKKSMNISYANINL